MSTVTLTIGPKNYTVACADGEEGHVEALGAMIAEKYALLGASRAPLEAQNLLFAALFLADELTEARKGKGKPRGKAEPDTTGETESLRAEIARLQGELTAARSTQTAPASTQPNLFGESDRTDALAERLETLAAKAEASAAALEALAQSA